LVDQYENYGDEIKEESILNATAGDQPTLDDSLGFSPYVEAIKQFLINPSTKPPLTLSIEGPWGSGKSSFMLQLKKKLDDDGEHTVLFNAWRHDKEDAMWAAFALEFIRQLSSDLTLFNYLKAEFRLFRSRIRWTNKRGDTLKIKAVMIFVIVYTAIILIIGYIVYIYNSYNWIYSLPTSLIIISLLGIGSPVYIPILSVLSNLKKLLGNSVYANLKKCIKKPDYENRTTFIEDFHEDFKNIVECYAGEKKVFVFIDDLDRCEVPKAADLMQALNLMISKDPRLVFIVGMDRLKVASGFAVKYEKLLPYIQSSKNYGTLIVQNGNYYKGLEYGYEFLEKFIQLPFLVPQPETSDLQEFVYNENVETTKGEKSNPKTSQVLFKGLLKKAEKFYDKGRNDLEKIKSKDQKQKYVQDNVNILKSNNPSKRDTAPQKIIAILPVYNEAHTIAEVIKSCKKYVDRVVIVDDGSADNTVDIAESLGAYVVHHETNKGYGAALKTSFKTAADFGADIVVIMRLMDWQDPPGISKLVDPIIKDEADIVVGISHQNDLNNSTPIYRRIGQIILDIFTSWDSGIINTDSNSSFHALASTKDIFRFDAQDTDISKMFEKALKAGLRIKRIELGIGYNLDDPIKTRIQENRETNDAIKQSKEKQRTLIEKVKVTVSSDSLTVRQIIRMVLPALDYNPRRIKQFLNLFRLKAFIASETGLFCISENTSSESNLTLEKLGKFIAITLKWPLLLSEIHLNPNLLNELQKISLKKPNNTNEVSEEAKYWIAQEKLIDLLRYGCLNNDGSINPESENVFSLSNLNVSKLLQTSPKIDRNTIITIFEIKTKILETNFQDLSDKKQAWLSLHRLIYDEDNDIRWRAAKAMGNAYKYLSEKEEALKDLYILTSDKRESVRVYANHSLGKISIFNASQAENENDYKKELQKAIEFFEKSSRGSFKGHNPSEFCLLFYRSFYAIIFKKGNARDDLEKYLTEAKLAIGNSENEKLLLEAIEKLPNVLKDIEDLGKMNLSEMKAELDLYRNNCKQFIELIKSMEKVAPAATTAIKESSPIIDREIKEIIQRIHESLYIALEGSKGTLAEELLLNISNKVEKWNILSQEELSLYTDDLLSTLESKIPRIPENKIVFEKIENIKSETDLIKQYEHLIFIIGVLPHVQSKGNIPNIGSKVEEIKPTIGIITALPMEYVAVKIMLENANEENKIPRIRSGGRYCLGITNI